MKGTSARTPAAPALARRTGTPPRGLWDWDAAQAQGSVLEGHMLGVGPSFAFGLLCSVHGHFSGALPFQSPETLIYHFHLWLVNGTGLGNSPLIYRSRVQYRQGRGTVPPLFSSLTWISHLSIRLVPNTAPCRHCQSAPSLGYGH